jgi:hypothetical protein
MVLHRGALCVTRLPSMVAARTPNLGAADPVCRALARECGMSARVSYRSSSSGRQAEIVGHGFLEILDRARLTLTVRAAPALDLELSPLAACDCAQSWFQQSVWVAARADRRLLVASRRSSWLRPGLYVAQHAAGGVIRKPA